MIGCALCYQADIPQSVKALPARVGHFYSIPKTDISVGNTYCNGAAFFG